MCFGDDARPPLPPISGAAADQGDLVLEASDGTRFAAYFARAAQPTGAGMVVLPDVRGLHRFYKELAQRFADGDDFEYMPHVQQTTPEAISADTAAAIDYLKSKDGGAVKSVFTVGFCFGGSNSWIQSATNPGLSGCIGFYGRPMRAEAFISRMKAPLLVLIAGADGATTPEQNQEFLRELDKTHVPHESEIFEGAPHSFFDRTYEQWHDASDRAWRHILDFVDKHSRTAV